MQAAASWNLLVALARIWRDHPEFPAAAVEPFDFACESAALDDQAPRLVSDLKPLRGRRDFRSTP